VTLLSEFSLFGPKNVKVHPDFLSGEL